MATMRSLSGWLVALLVAIGAIVALYLHPEREVFRIYDSPQGTYHLIVYRYHSRLPVMPGDSSGGPGYVCLYDSHGKLWGEAKLPILSAASSATDVKCDTSEVSLPGAFDFAIPKEDETQPEPQVKH